MDVRCDRCQTEYELDDSSVSEIGTEVECGDCGHTFKIKRSKSAEDLPQEPHAAEWLLETKAGQSHRFRDLTLLQKWIIERKATRDDKISRSGQAWRRLGEIVELAPFFDVVDEADKARATAASSSSGLPQQSLLSPSPISPMPSLSGSMPMPTSISAPLLMPTSISASLTMPSPSPQTTLEGINMPAFASTLPLSNRSSGAYPMATGQGDTALIPVPPPKSRGLLKLLVTTVVAAGVAYMGISWFQSRNPQSTTATPSLPTLAVEPAKSPGSITVTPVAALPENPVVAMVEAPSSPPESATEPAAKKARAAQGRREAGASPYVRLVADGDHFRVRAQANKARQRYEYALKLNHEGGEALTGLGLVALSIKQHSSAIAYFRRALQSNPSMGPALFGLAEAYRVSGLKPDAMQAYRHYLQTLPQGSDATAALKHLKALDNDTR